MKKNAFRRLVSLLLVTVMVVGMLPSVFAVEGTGTDAMSASSSLSPAGTVENTEAPAEETEPGTTTPMQAPAETTEATEPPAETTEATEAPTEATEATEAPAETTEPTEVPTETTEDAETPTEATEAAEAPTETTEATEPTEETEPTGPVSDPTADLETAAIWEATVANVKLTGDPAKDILLIAQSQLGYTESQTNFIIDEHGNEDGITRYGQWYGVPYGDWCAMFVSFCLDHGKIEGIPLNSNCNNWIQKATEKDLYVTAAEWDPSPGDIVFFDNSYNDGIADHVGIVYKNNGTTVVTIEGNYDDKVSYVTRSLTDGSILGYIPLSDPTTEQLRSMYDEIYDLLGLDNEMYKVDYPGKITNSAEYIGVFTWDVYSQSSYADLTLMAIHLGIIENPEVKAKLDEYGWFSMMAMGQEPASPSTNGYYYVYKDLLGTHSTDVVNRSLSGWGQTINGSLILAGSDMYPNNATWGQRTSTANTCVCPNAPNGGHWVNHRTDFGTNTSPYLRVNIGTNTWAYPIRPSMEVGLKDDLTFSGTRRTGSGAFPSTFVSSNVGTYNNALEWTYSSHITLTTEKYNLMSVILGVANGMGITSRDVRDVATHTLLMNAYLGWIKIGSNGQVYGSPILATNSLGSNDVNAEMVEILVRVEAYCKAKGLTGTGSGTRSASAIANYLKIKVPAFNKVPTAASKHGASYISWAENYNGPSNSSQLWIYGTNVIEFDAGNMTINKSSPSGDVSNYCFKLYHWDSSTVYYGKSDTNGKVYVTDSSYAQSGSSKTYTFEGMEDGRYTILEVLSQKGAGDVFPSSIVITVKNSSGAVTFTKTYSGSAITKDTNGDARLEPVDSADSTLKGVALTGLSAGGTLEITVNNVSTNVGNLSVTKTIQPASLNTGANRSGWRFELYSSYAAAVSGGTNYLAYAISNTNGVATFENLPVGTTYYVREAPASRQTKDTTGWELNAVVKSGTVGSGTVSVGSIANTRKAYVSIAKSANCSAAIYNQIKDNPLYSLAGAKYDLYIDGVYQETLTTDTSGNATSSKSYTYGQSGYLIETSAPAGFKLDSVTRWAFTINSTNLVVSVTDEPVFDPGDIRIQKVDAATDTAQGNTSFEGAIFKWEFFDSYTPAANAEPVRTWYFRTDANSYHRYNAAYLVDNATYSSDELYVNVSGITSLPLGFVRVTEVVAPTGYTVINTPLEGMVTQTASGAKFAWTDGTNSMITVKADGTTEIDELPDLTTYGAVSIQKLDAETGLNARFGTDFAGCEFTVYNNSANSVAIGDTVAAPGDACYTIVVDAAGNAVTDKVFPIGSYIVKETKGNEYYLCNTEWSAEFTIEGDETEAVAIECSNTVVKGNFKLYKVEEGTNGNATADAPLATDAVILKDAKYKFWNPDGSELGEYTTDENGVIEILDLVYGKGYSYQEIEPPAGYDLDETVYTFDITGNSMTVTHVREDKPTEGSISVQKDSSYGAPMEGVSFLLEYSTDNGATWNPVTSREADSPVSVGGCTSDGLTDGALNTDANGQCVFTGLRVSSGAVTVRYRLTEIATQSGYTLLTETVFEGELPGDEPTVSLAVVNSPDFELPQSGSAELMQTVTLGAVLMMAGLYICLAVFVSLTKSKKKD